MNSTNTENTTERARGVPLCSALSAGDTIQRGDLFRADDGRLLEMDNLGRLLGVRVLGETLKRGGDWFRPMPNDKLSGGTPSAQAPCSACGGTGQDDPPPGKYHGLCLKCGGSGKQNGQAQRPLADSDAGREENRE